MGNPEALQFLVATAAPLEVKYGWRATPALQVKFQQRAVPQLEMMPGWQTWSSAGIPDFVVQEGGGQVRLSRKKCFRAKAWVMCKKQSKSVVQV